MALSVAVSPRFLARQGQKNCSLEVGSQLRPKHWMRYRMVQTPVIGELNCQTLLPHRVSQVSAATQKTLSN
jgi:hypothetical protein